MRVPPPDKELAVERARSMRRDGTPSERALWRALRNRLAIGVKVRRQVPVGRYFLDFAILAHRVAIEVDGETHATAEGLAADQERTAWLVARGWRVLRFGNREVLGNLEGVLLAILGAVASDPHPGPLPEGEGEG